jgi:lipopolysaccharide biosynthesis glycosyltransferase
MQDKHLVYYTVGFNATYIDVLALSIKSLRRKNSQDILVICDESMVSNCQEKLKDTQNIWVCPCPDSTDPMDSSFKKLTIYNYDISKYDKIIYIDSDILVDVDLEYFFNNIHDGKLYAFAEHLEFIYHVQKYHSLLSYTDEELEFLVSNKIHVFNAGLFGFVKSPDMKDHFEKVIQMKEGYTGEYWYEQSFMNVYFNLRKLVDTDLINRSNCHMNIHPRLYIENTRPWVKSSKNEKFFHFCVPRNPSVKLGEMKWWMNRFFDKYNGFHRSMAKYTQT